MSSPIEIVIRAVDQFSPVFAGLDSALQRTDGVGRAAQGALAAVGGSLERIVETGAAADGALAGFVAGAEQRLHDLDTQRQAALVELTAQHEQAAQLLSERLAALDEAGTARREAQRDGAFSRETAAWAAHHTALLELETHFQHQLLALDETVTAARLETFRQLTASLLALAQAHGGALARTTQALAVAEALISAYLAGSKALASVPFPLNLAAAAAVTAQGLAMVERIRQVHIAHGGLEHVPEEATYLLQRGERVLSGTQNRDLTRFLAGTGPGAEGAPGSAVAIENLTIHVLEHATNADALLAMDAAQLRQVVADRLIPMLDELARLGIRPRFIASNT